MFDGPIRLRRRRAIRAGRRSGRWRLPLAGGILALIIGAACWAPLAPRTLAPSVVVDPSLSEAAPPPALAQTAGVVPPAVAVIAATPTVAPTTVPTPAVIPTLTPGGLALLAAIKSDRTAQWVKNHTETALRSGPNDSSVVFTMLPQWSTLKQTDSRPDWLLVDYAGDGDTRLPGPGWVKASDVGGIDPPTVWLSSIRPASLWSTADSTAKPIVQLPTSTLMELSGPVEMQGTRVHVRLPGDGRQVPPTEGWVDGDRLGRVRTPAPGDLPWAYPEDLRADVRINVPYRSQLDGSDYASANCGPTVLGMALESFGVNLAPTDLRGQVLNTEALDPTDDDAGSFIWALAQVAQSEGVPTHGLYETDGSGFHHWSLDEIRASLHQGQPVIVQVVYRGLPGREDSGYYGDHYIVITGLMGQDFLYNDPIGGNSAHESPGWDRIIAPSQLDRAMHASDTNYAYTAFSLGKN
ncbi:MAG TPA: C39 family peptidase [Chloroflexota bacterium]|nr:C39 family peptidase [Chloroflexota bacterium]